jgi:transposase
VTTSVTVARSCKLHGHAARNWYTRRHGNSLRDIVVETGMAGNAIREYLASGSPQRKARQPVVGKRAPLEVYLLERVEAA